MLDFFRGVDAKEAESGAFEQVIVLSAPLPPDQSDLEKLADANPSSLPIVHFRVYSIRNFKSGQELPRVELHEMGPRLDLQLRRSQEASKEMQNAAFKRSKQLEPPPRKNIETNLMGDKLGRVHVGKQDIFSYQTRKMKGLKRSRDMENGEMAEEELDGNQ
jgi:ribosome production factor 2